MANKNAIEFEFADLLRKLEIAENKIPIGINNGLKEVGEDIKQEAIPITPRLTGALRDSAHVELNKFGDNVASVEVSFGIMTKDLAPLDYALPQEYGDKEGYRNYTTPGTGPRFLSNAANNTKPTIIPTLTAYIKKWVNIF